MPTLRGKIRTERNAKRVFSERTQLAREYALAAMSNTLEPRAPGKLEEDLYFIFDEEDVSLDAYNKGLGIIISSKIDWAALESDGSQDSIDAPKIKRKKKKRGFKQHGSKEREVADLSATTFKAFASFADETNDLQIQSHSQSFRNAEIEEVPLLSAKHKDYRRFRYYDLIRSKLELGELESIPPVGNQDEKVHFDTEIGIHEFYCDDTLSCAVISAPDSRPLSILLKKHKLEEPPVCQLFSFLQEEYSQDLCKLMNLTQDNYSLDLSMDFHELYEIMALAQKQAGVATENVLCAFEGMSSMGKHLIGIVNRLQALATRFLVLRESQSLENSSELLFQLHACTASCEDLKRDIILFKMIVLQSREHLEANMRHILTGISDSVNYLTKVKELFAMVYQKDEDCWTALQSIIGVSESYTRCVNFLHEMTPERVFRFLKHDFTKMQNDIGNMDYLCGLLLEQTRQSPANVIVPIE